MDTTFDDVTVEHVRIGLDTLVKDAGGEELGSLLASGAGQLIAKAGWNFFLIEGDGSDGIPNPSFTLEVIEATIKALEPAPVVEEE